jgi:hypothetical protein
MLLRDEVIGMVERHHDEEQAAQRIDGQQADVLAGPLLPSRYQAFAPGKTIARALRTR